jgi:hypothetical protein
MMDLKDTLTFLLLVFGPFFGIALIAFVAVQQEHRNKMEAAQLRIKNRLTKLPESEAVSYIIREEIYKSGRRSLLQNIVISGVFYLLGLVTQPILTFLGVIKGS